MNENLNTPFKTDNTRFWHFRKKSATVLTHNVLPTSMNGRISDKIATFLGTPTFIMWLTIFCIVWLAWNTMMPEYLRFDSADFGFTALTLVLSLQASYAAPLILYAQNRQADRDKIMIENDRQRAERNLADTEYIMREIATLRLQLNDLATRDYVRQELRNILQELKEDDANLEEK